MLLYAHPRPRRRYNDEITDVCYVPVPLNKKGTSMSTLPTRVAVATNSEQLRIFDVNTFGSESFIGHTAVILAVACSPDGRFVATSSKDKTVRCVAAVLLGASGCAVFDDVGGVWRQSMANQ